MSKITAFLATVGLMLVSLSIQAQPTFTFSPSDPMPPLGAQITVDVLVDDFTDITSYQYSVNWNPAHFSYVSIGNFNGDLGLGAGNFGTTMTSSGKLTTLWSDPMANPQSIANGSVLFTITLDVVAAAPVTTDIEFTGDPTAIEVTQDTGSGIMDITGSTTFVDTSIDIAGGGGGGGPTCSFSGFGLLVDSDSAATGEQVCLNVSTCNFTDIVSMQYTMQFNPNLLQFDNVGAFNLQNLDAGAFGTTNAGQGFITVSWFDSLGAGVTLPNETAIYEICFTAIGAGGEMDTVAINGALAPIEVTDVNSGGGNIGLESVDGEVLITGTSGSAVTVFASCEEGNSGDTVYVDVSVRNFTDMLGLQYSMLWDTAVVDFYETVWTGALPGSPTFNTSPALVDAGKLTFLWSDPLVTGVTVPDSTIIYQVGFIVVGDVAEMTAVNFTDDPTAIEATQDNMGTPEIVPLARIPGKVEVLGEGLFNLILNDATACTGDTIDVPVTVEGFNEIISMQYDIRWSPGDLEYLGLNSYNLSGLNNGSFNQVNDSTLRCVWVEPVLNPQTKPDGDTLYNMRFVVLGADATTTDLLVLDEPGHLFEITDNDGLVDPYLHTDGEITVNCTTTPIEVTDTLITNVLCNGDATGAIDITVTGGSGSFTYSWSNGPTTEDITGLTAGDYTVTISSGGLTEIQTYTVTEPAELTATTSVTDASCNGDSDGTASVTPSGGTPGYTYEWSNAGETTQSISDVPAGIYTVTVTDANMCTVAVMATVGEPDALVLNTSSTPASCNGGSDGTATVTPSGGTPGYSYAWGSGITETTATVSDLSAGSYAVTVTDANMCTAVTSIVVGEPDVLTATATATDVTCNGDTDGATSLTVNGGTTPYDYDWDNDGTGDTGDPQNLNNIGPGTYNVTVTDANGCTATASATVDEPAVVSATAVITHESAVDADDGAIDITANGGTPGYTYNWGAQGTNEDLTGLAPGMYTVTITDSNGCTGVESFEVFEFAAPVAVVDDVTDVSCNGGTDGAINITVTGGTPPIVSYDWGGGITDEDPTGLSADTYTVTVTDNAGVTATVTATVNEPDAITITEDNTTEVTCNASADGAIEVTVGGGTAPYTYDWGGGLTSEDIFGLSGDDYTLTVTDANMCTFVGNTITVDEPDPIVITVVSTTDPQCNGEMTGAIDITVSGGTAPYNYTWSTGANFTEDLVGLLAGTYTVTVTDNRGCVMVSNPITITEPPAIVVNSFAAMVTCHDFSDGSIDLSVSGGAGGPYTYVWNDGILTEDRAGLTAGSYTVTVTDSDNCTVVEGPIAVTQPAELTIDTDVTNASASNDDGAINVTINGGTPAYTYNWNTGETSEDLGGIASGCYVITVTDGNGCVVEDSTKVGGIIVVTNIATDVSCNGGDDGSIDINVTGGIQPYTFDWADPLPDVEDQNGLVAGTYCVTITDSNGSIDAQCITIDEPDALTILSSTITDETGAGCNGDIDIEVIGGTPGYNFQWNNGSISEDLIDVCKGDYDVVITDDNGCILISNSFTVAPPPLVVAESDMSDASCFGASDGGGCIDVLGGCAPYTIKLLETGEEIISTDGEACFDNLPAGSYTISILDSGTPIMAISHLFTINQPDEIVILVDNMIDNTDPTGNDCNGAINISVTGGTEPFSYQWSNGMTSEDITNICEDGNPYSVTVTDDNGCVQILNGLELDLGLSVVVENVSDVTCVGDCDGAIDITVYGGTAPYTYVWTNGAGTVEDPINLCAGNYMVEVTDDENNTITIPVVTVDEPTEALAVNLISVTPPINDNSDGAIDIEPSGGWGGYTYQWSNGANSEDIGGIQEGTYTVTLTDGNGCQVIETIDLPATRLILTFEIGEPSCNGDNDGFIEVFVEGGSDNYSYNWSTGHTTSLAFDLEAGPVSVTVTDLDIPGLTATGDVNLNQPDRLIVTVECFENSGLQAVVEGGTEDYDYLWNTPAADTTPIVVNLPPGTYGVRVEDANGCVSIAQGETCNDSECFDAREIISVNGDGLNDVFIISCAENYNNTLRVFNRWGQLVYEATNYDNSWMGTDLDGNELPEDGYFYVLEYEEAGETIQIKGAITVLR